jgi:hypothetical protein
MPRACTWLIYLALENAVDDFWAGHARTSSPHHGRLNCSREQLIPISGAQWRAMAHAQPRR